MMAEMRISGHRHMMDKLTLFLCANESGDCKIKQLLVNRLEHLRHTKLWKKKCRLCGRQIEECRVTRQLDVEWVNLVFGRAVSQYLQENKLHLQTLFVLDNAHVHSLSTEDDILKGFKCI